MPKNASEHLSTKYPLHTLVWYDKPVELNELLKQNKDDIDIEQLDPRNRTPLMLAIRLNRYDCANALINSGANANTETDGWSAIQEATVTRHRDLMKLILETRNTQRKSHQHGGIPQLLHKLKQAPDFFVEMKWEFTSWMPLVTRMCPSDTYKIYKQGSKVRIDSTLTGFEEYKWLRGNTSFIFKVDDDHGTIIELDHNTKKVFIDRKYFAPHDNPTNLRDVWGPLNERLQKPLVSSYIDTKKISFERSKSGLWGWRQDKTEMVNGYECKVYSASNVELVTRTRTEHLSEEQKIAHERNGNTMQNLLTGLVEKEEEAANYQRFDNTTDPSMATFDEYFTEGYDLHGRDVGEPMEMTTRIRKFKANLWLCKNYPLSLQEQISPIVDLMASSSSNFDKLKDFIEMQLPTGFPIKIEIPLFHVLNARVTFENLFAIETPVPGVMPIRDSEPPMCDIDESLFEAPADYTLIEMKQSGMEDDDDMLQLALQNSFLDDRNQVNVWEALQSQNGSPVFPDTEEQELQRAIEESLLDRGSTSSTMTPRNLTTTDVDLLAAVSLSLKEQEEIRREEELFQQALRRSIRDK